MNSKMLLAAGTLAILLTFSCKKEDTTSTDNTPVATELKIDPIKKRYIASDGTGHYAGTFVNSKTIYNFKFQVENGKNYRIIVSQPYVDYPSVKLILVNSKGDTLYMNNNYVVPMISFTAHFDGTVYLRASLPSGNNNVGSDYYLILENTDSYYPLDWAGKKWQASGNWKINSDGYLTFVGEKSGIYRWIRLDTILFQYDASFLCRTLNGNGKTKVGIAVNGSSQIQTDNNSNNSTYNLPLNGAVFTVDNLGNYNYISQVGVSNSWPSSNNNGAFSSANINEWRPFEAISPSQKSTAGNTLWDMNCKGVNYSTYSLANAIKGYFYLVVEDKNTDEINFDSFKIVYYK